MSVEDLLYPLLSRYFAAPNWLKSALGRAYACLPERIRLGAPYYAARQELEATRGDGDAARALARAKLAGTLQWAVRTVPQYRGLGDLLKRDLAPEELLARMPVTDKLDIKRNPEFYLSRDIPPGQRLRTETGGSTRNPLVFYLHKHVTRAREYAFMQDFRSRLGTGDDGAVTLGLLGRMYRDAQCTRRSAWTYEPIKKHLVLSPSHLDERHLPQFAEVLLQHRPRYIEGFPSMLFPLARWLEKNPLPGFTDGVQGIMLISENIHDFQMELFRRVFRCAVLRHYGHSERILMAATMPDDDRYFFWPQYGWFELLDFEDRPITRPGVLGHIVGTSFDNLAMPFVRYRTGDLGVLSSGGEHPRLPGYVPCERIEGRVQEFIVDRHQRLISLIAVGSAHFPWFSAIDSLQYEQDRPGELIMRFVPLSGFNEAMEHHMASAVGERTCCDVRIARVERIPRTPRGKQNLLVQNLDVSRYLRGTGTA